MSMTIQEQILQHIRTAFEKLFDYSIHPSELTLQPTRKEFTGDYTFVLFPFSRITKISPEESAGQIGEYLKAHVDLVKDYNVVKGFLNISVKETYWLEVFKSIVQNETYGQLPPNGQKVMVEYSSPNTNKPLHLGHLRNNFLGFSVSEILKANGYEVIRANLVNDRGIHICKSMVAYLHFGNGETPESSGLKGDHLAGKYYVLFDTHYKKQVAGLVEKGVSEETARKSAPLMKEAQEMLLKWENADEEVLGLWKRMNAWV